MMVRFENRIVRLMVVLAMTLSVVVFAFSSPASNHARGLHASASIEASSDLHDDDHAGHSHDEVADVSGDQQVASHHHADHSHEKVGFLSLPGFFHHAGSDAVFSRLTKSLADGLSDGIDRPPRSVFRI